MLNRIIIWGGDNFNTLGLLRQLHGRDRSIFFLMLGSPTGCASASKWFGEFQTTRTIIEGYQYLISHFSEEASKPVVFTPSDEIIEFIDQHKSELEKLFVVPGTREPGHLTFISDKNKMTELAQRIGFIVPQSHFCNKLTDVTDIQYPCIIKPAHSTVGHRNEFKFIKCENKRDLSNVLRCVRRESEFIVQQFIPNDRVALVYGARLKSGAVITAGTLIKDRFIACGDGSHGELIPELPKGVEIAKIEAFLSSIDYNGLFSFEFGLYNERAFFFEVNLRNDGTSHYFYQSGANIPLAWYFDAIGRDYNGVPTALIDNAWFIDEVFDITNVWNCSISRKQWRADKKQATVFKYYDIDDQAPWKRVKHVRIKKIILDAIVKKLRPYIVWVLDKLDTKK